MGSETGDEAALDRGERKGARPPARGAREGVTPQVANHDGGRRRVLPGATEPDIHIADQRIRLERLGQPMVRTAMQRRPLELGGIQPGDGDDLLAHAARPELIDHLQAVHAGHCQVEHDHGRLVADGRLDTLVAVGRGEHLEAASAEKGSQAVQDVNIIIYE